MADPVISNGFGPPVDPTSPASAGRSCSTCRGELDRLPPSARFCPHCGGKLPDPPAIPFARPASHAAVPAVASQWLEMGPVDGTDSPGAADGETRSLMLLGYANAMYNLGQRYESGRGTWRNPEEAVRCYYKAAKLGDSRAAARLTPRCTPAPEAPSSR